MLRERNVLARRLSCLGTMAFGAALSACVAAPVESGDEPIGAAASRQIDPYRSYVLTQAGSTVASVWHGTTSGGADVEYWAALPAYDAGAARTFTGATQSCTDWKRSVCGSGWSTATYYKPIVHQTTLDCAFPPGPCTPARGATTFLRPGSYQTTGAGVPFAWTYVSGACEYWAMDHTISSGTNTQSPTSPGWTSLGGFEAAMCAQSTVPTTWFSATYQPYADFCAAETC